MSGFGDYPPNMAPQDALVVRSQKEADHAVVPYTAEDLARPTVGPANPFRRAADTNSVGGQKRKNVLSGTATETYLSEHAFRSKHRAVEQRGGPQRAVLSGAQVKAQNAAVRAAREGKGDAMVADGDGAYVGPWAKFKRGPVYEGGGEEEYEEYEEVEEEEEEEDVVESGTVIPAPAAALARRKEAATEGTETSTFVGSEQYDYQGRTYMHVPQDLDVDLRKEVGSITNFIPRKLVYTWKAAAPGQGQGQASTAVTALRLFPVSGHLLLSGSADSTVRLYDVYHERELLRTYAGHTRALTDLSFNRDGTRFLTGSHDRWMKLWDTETGQCINRFRTGKTPHCVVFNPSAERAHEFLSGMSNNKILQWDTRASGSGAGGSSEPVQDYDHHLAAVNTITFVDENRRFMSTSDDKSVRVWDYDIPVPISYTSEPWMYPLTRAAAHPSHKYVAYQSGDNQVLVYAARDKYRQNRKKEFKGHNNAGTAIGIDISPDGQFLASGDTSGYVCFWDWKTCKMYEKLKADAAGGSINHVLWHPQETSKVFTAGAQGDIKLWD